MLNTTEKRVRGFGMGSYDHRSKTSKPFVYFWESLTSKEGARERGTLCPETHK
jgi:hypothetical protein